jgi:hypothetical protein
VKDLYLKVMISQIMLRSLRSRIMYNIRAVWSETLLPLEICWKISHQAIVH